MTIVHIEGRPTRTEVEALGQSPKWPFLDTKSAIKQDAQNHTKSVSHDAYSLPHGFELFGWQFGSTMSEKFFWIVSCLLLAGAKIHHSPQDLNWVQCPLG